MPQWCRPRGFIFWLDIRTQDSWRNYKKCNSLHSWKKIYQAWRGNPFILWKAHLIFILAHHFSSEENLRCPVPRWTETLSTVAVYFLELFHSKCFAFDISSCCLARIPMSCWWLFLKSTDMSSLQHGRRATPRVPRIQSPLMGLLNTRRTQEGWIVLQGCKLRQRRTASALADLGCYF